MNEDYLDLKRLENVIGYKKLQALWLHQVSDIEKARDKAAKRGSETAWRYWAGQEAGFKLAMTALDRAIQEIEKNEENLDGEEHMNRVLDELKIKVQGEEK